MSTSTYPVHVDAQLDPQVSRWQWMFKWFLAIPHYVALAFLWLAFVVLSMVAFVAILFTGRYPRAIFDFNVGVLRWTWRVGFYAYSALGTDRYPPFSLGEHPDYPARLTIDYPAHLSQGLVLVKWWLLAIPHYLVLGLLLGGTSYVVTEAGGSGERLVWSGGLIGLMVVIAGFTLLFTGRYPQPLFDLVLGLNRWVLRVAGYAALMTDQYPPFRLDQGGPDPGSGHLALSPVDPRHQAAGLSAATAAPRPPTKGWTAGPVLSAVVGSVVLVGALGLGVGGTALLIADQTGRDSGGFLMSPQDTVSTGTYAVTTDNLEIHTDVPSVVMPERLLGDAKITATPAQDTELFLGVARTADVDAYLNGVERETLVGFTDNPVYRTDGTSAPTVAPTDTDIWVAQSSGTDTQSVTWPMKNGNWTVVTMNADGSAGLTADVSVGATVPILDGIISGLFGAAVVGLLLGGLLLALGVRSADKAV